MLRASLGARLRAITAVSASAALLGFALVGPASADPDEPTVDDIDEVSEQVDSLWHDAEQAQERFHDAKIELKDLRRELRGLQADQDRQSDRVEGAQSQVEDSIVSQYTGGAGVGTVGELAVSEDPSSFLADLSTMSSFNEIQDDLFDDYSTELTALGLRESVTTEREADLEAISTRLREEKQTVEDKAAEAQEVLDDLEAEEREALEAAQAAQAAEAAESAESAGAESAAPAAEAPTDVPASGRAQAAIDYAMAQVGKAYVYGASGPDAFDCSGLTSMAWAQAGVALPRSSGAQLAGGGAPVSTSELQPGDLVFYYSPVSHVAMYIGGGQIVHAANPGTGVAVAGVDSMPISGAVRPG